MKTTFFKMGRQMIQPRKNTSAAQPGAAAAESNEEGIAAKKRKDRKKEKDEATFRFGFLRLLRLLAAKISSRIETRQHPI